MTDYVAYQLQHTGEQVDDAVSRALKLTAEGKAPDAVKADTATTAANATKLGGQPASYYGTANAVAAAATAAANAQASNTAATSISYSITAAASAWVAGSLTHLGQTYAYKAAITASAAKGDGKGIIVEPSAGSAEDLQAWGVADVTAGVVTLWSKTKPTGSITLKITEVR